MIKYDQSLLQSQSGFKMIELVLELNDKLKEYRTELNSMIKDDTNCVDADIVDDEVYSDLQKQVKMLKNDHNKALNCLTGFRGKTYYNQRQYMRSEVRLERYKKPL